ncbi:MAG: spore germination protein, partial [Clostridia bacterium]|nr:spore germination protein [Clostridia bacterium]
NTERPDIVAAQLLEGCMAVLVDGSPFALIVPTVFFQFLQANEDYYERFLVASILRWLRYALFLASLFLPALFVAVLTYQPEMLPTPFLLTVMGAREAVPLPIAVETFVMELSLEALREAGLRLPRPTGQAVSIVGAVILGLAGVQAGFVAAPVVIVVSLTGIASFSAPRYSFALAARLLRFGLLIAASVLGLFGFMVASMAVLFHLCRLRSLGIPYLSPVAPRSIRAQADILARRPHDTRSLIVRWPGRWRRQGRRQGIGP